MSTYEFVIEGDYYGGIGFNPDPYANDGGWTFFDTTDLLDLGDKTTLTVIAADYVAAEDYARETLGKLAAAKYRRWNGALWWQNPPEGRCRRVFRWE